MSNQKLTFWTPPPPCPTSSILKTPPLPCSQTSGSYPKYFRIRSGCLSTGECLQNGRSFTTGEGIQKGVFETKNIFRLGPKYFAFVDILFMPDLPPTVCLSTVLHPPSPLFERTSLIDDPLSGMLSQALKLVASNWRHSLGINTMV